MPLSVASMSLSERNTRSEVDSWITSLFRSRKLRHLPVLMPASGFVSLCFFADKRVFLIYAILRMLLRASFDDCYARGG